MPLRATSATIGSVKVQNAAGVEINPVTDDPKYYAGLSWHTDPTKIKTLNAKTTNDARYMSFEQPTGTDYVVPTGKVFYITRIVWMGSATTTILTKIGYANDGVADGAAAPTTPIELLLSDLTAKVADTPYTLDVFLAVPTGKYPYQYQNGAGSLYTHLIGIEV